MALYFTVYLFHGDTFFIASVYVLSHFLGEGEETVHKEGVGIIEVKGLILESQETVKQIQAFRKNDKVKAIVLRIDSPGGVLGHPKRFMRL